MKLKSARSKNIIERPHVKRGAKYLATPFRRGLAFVASAAMLTLIQPPNPAGGGEFQISNFKFQIFPLLAWVSLVPFILACSPKARPIPLVIIAYIVSLCYWLGNLYWVFPITIAGWAAFCVYTAVLWPIVALCLRYCRIKKIPLFLASGVLFVGAERLQGFFLGGFFWRFLAHSQYHNITIIQIADIFGAAGVSFLIAMVNGLLAELILDARCCIKQKTEDRKQKTEDRISVRCPLSSVLCSLTKIVIVCSLIAVTVVYGRWRINQSDKFVTNGPLIASLQSNVPQSVKREALRAEAKVAEKTSQAIFDELMQKSKAAVEAGAELIVWPETMVQATLNPEVLDVVEPEHPWKVFDQALRDHSKNNAFLLVGAFGGTPDETKTELVERYNSAFLYKKDGQQYEKRYDKIHLVLFGEVLPFRKSFPLLFNLLMKFNPYGFDHSLEAGSEYSVFEMTDSRSQNYKFSVMICYEATVPEIARRFTLERPHVKRGAKPVSSQVERYLAPPFRRGSQKRIDWLVNISNDGWFVRFEKEKVLPSTELPQHAAICVFRAVENRVSIVRSVNTGISCLIDSLGRIKNGFSAGTLPHDAMQRKGIDGWFADEMPIDKRVTFFSKHGQWLDFCCVVCLGLLIIIQMIGNRINNKWLKGSWLNKLSITNRRLLTVLLFTFPLVFLAGCEESLSLQTAVNQPSAVSVDNLVPQALEIIEAGLADADPQVRANAIEVIAATKQIMLMPKVQRLLQDEVVPVRFSAVLAVADLEYSLAKSDVQSVADGLKDEDENVRIAAAYAMTKFGHSEYLTVFRDSIASKDQTVRANAALLLGKSGNKDALRLLYWALQSKDSSDKVRFQAVEAIAVLGDERIFPKLWAIAYSGYADDRIIGIRAMGALKTVKAKDVLVTKLDDDILEVRLAAAEQLGKLNDSTGEPEVLDVFEKNLTSRLDKKELERVKVLTALAIGQIGTENLKRFLPQLLTDESKSVRIAAARAVLQCAIRQ
jgi:apolipoprotein N-acyltransferase